MNEPHPIRALLETEERTLFSTHVGRDYHLFVALPENYATSGQSYPVVYLLDGNVMFGMAAGLAPGLHWSREAPELIVVGIGYDVDTFEQWGHQREREYKMPDVRDAPPDSYAGRFLGGAA
jgi:predicted alpha/beta superfamily hydrolase